MVAVFEQILTYCSLGPCCSVVIAMLSISLQRWCFSICFTFFFFSQPLFFFPHWPQNHLLVSPLLVPWKWPCRAWGPSWLRAEICCLRWWEGAGGALCYQGHDAALTLITCHKRCFILCCLLASISTLYKSFLCYRKPQRTVDQGLLAYIE